MNRDIIAFTKYKFNVYGNKDIRSGKDSAVVGIVGKSKSLDFLKMLIFWSLVRNSVIKHAAPIAKNTNCNVFLPKL